VYVCARGEAELTTSLQDWKSAGLDIDGCTADVSIEEHRTELIRKVRLSIACMWIAFVQCLEDHTIAALLL
jgi:hypothetical protein